MVQGESATAAVWNRFSSGLRRFIRSRVKREDATEDILQNVSAKVQAGISTVRDAKKLEPWLFQVTRRAIIDYFRERSPERRVAPLPENLAEDRPSPTASVEIAPCLNPMLAKLAPDDRQALEIADIDGTSQKDLAGRLGLSASGAKSRVQRARVRLKAMLLECCHIETDRRGNVADYTPRKSCDPCSCG
jgi:RNA polymerase sigma-70 factor (ECF subfamily)